MSNIRDEVDCDLCACVSANERVVVNVPCSVVKCLCECNRRVCVLCFRCTIPYRWSPQTVRNQMVSVWTRLSLFPGSFDSTFALWVCFFLVLCFCVCVKDWIIEKPRGFWVKNSLSICPSSDPHASTHSRSYKSYRSQNHWIDVFRRSLWWLFSTEMLLVPEGGSAGGLCEPLSEPANVSIDLRENTQLHYFIG